jgi:Transposase DDE domain
MRILGFTFTSGNTDDRAGLEMIWEGIIGMIVTDGGYVGKDFQEKAEEQDIFIFAAARANMKKLMTTWQHQLFKMRQAVERVFSVLKHRMGMETSLPRSLR